MVIFGGEGNCSCGRYFNEGTTAGGLGAAPPDAEAGVDALLDNFRCHPQQVT